MDKVWIVYEKHKTDPIKLNIKTAVKTKKTPPKRGPYFDKN